MLELDETRPLVQSGRSIAEVREFIAKNNITAEGLLNGGKLLDYSWSRNADKYYREFDFQKLGYFLLAPPINDEWLHTKNGCWYLVDGNHRALALIAKLCQPDFEFQPVEAIFTYFERERLAQQGVKI